MINDPIVRSSTFAIKLLKGIAISGMVLVAASNPLFGPKLLQLLIKKYRKKNKRSVEKSFHYLKNRGYVNLEWLADGRLKVEITKQGKKVVEKLSLDDLKISKPNQWDQRWRVVIFDVPNTHSKNRRAFTQHLKNLGFQMAQKSVWIYPYLCHREIMILRKFYRIESTVIYMETSMVEDGELWRERFDL